VNAKLIPIAKIDVPTPLLAYHATRTVEIAATIRGGKAIEPLSVVKISGRYILIEGKDELAALKLVGAETAPVRIEMVIGKSSRRNRRGIS
jgi:ParB-like nuclease domain